MDTSPSCPVCQSQSWTVIGTRTYRHAEMAKAATYVRKRLEVLFQVWFPGAAEVQLSSVLCGQCGFVCYSPRPTEVDIDRKYAFLAEDTSTHGEIAQDHQSDQLRSEDLYRHVRHSIRPNASVLDFGGGNGRLMRAFLAHDHECFVLDYAGPKLPGVHYLGERLADIESGRKFDLIVCSHVLEHLASPYETVASLRPYLAPAGVLYVEVPLEIWRQPPLPVEPVTHVNYFTVDSLRAMLQRAGFAVAACDDGTYTTEGGAPGLAIRARASPNAANIVEWLPTRAARNTQNLLHPNAWQRVVRAARFPAVSLRAARQRLARRLGRLPLLWRLVPTRRRP